MLIFQYVIFPSIHGFQKDETTNQNIYNVQKPFSLLSKHALFQEGLSIITLAHKVMRAVAMRAFACGHEDASGGRPPPPH